MNKYSDIIETLKIFDSTIQFGAGNLSSRGAFEDDVIVKDYKASHVTIVA